MEGSGEARGGRGGVVLEVALVLGFCLIALAAKWVVGLRTPWGSAIDLALSAPLLALVWRLSRARGESAATFTEAMTRKAVWDIALLFMAGTAAYAMTYGVLERLVPPLAEAALLTGRSSLRSSLALPALLLAASATVLEEWLLRGLLQTRLRQLGAPAALAVAVSALAQAALHLDMGWLPALGLAAQFTLFAAYYHRTRLLLPVVVAHAMQVGIGLASLTRG